MKARTLAVVLASAASLAGGFWWARRSAHGPLPVDAWEPVLRENRGPSEAERLLAQTAARYRDLVGARPLPRELALRRHLLRYVLPGLALYQTLLEEHGADRAAALAETGPLFRAWTVEDNRMVMRLSRVLPQPFMLFRLALAFRAFSYPKAGWRFHTLENSARRIAFDNTSCFYLDALESYGAPELTPCFCDMDEWLAEMLPPDIVFSRTQTLSRSGECCDFRYEIIPLQVRR